jgi:ABC-type uncharacterized transport system permease subunit
MDFPDLTILIASVIVGAAPIVIAVIGETISEKSGIINLSLDGTILFTAMVGFAVAYESGSVTLGFFAAGAAGALIAAVVAYFSIYLGLSQVAVGFVLTLMARDLAYFFGNPYSRLSGPQVAHLPLALLKDIPVVGPVFFQHNLPIYLSFVLIPLATWYIYATPLGLKLRSAGENPRATYARGVRPHVHQFFYTMVGGLLVGIAGATFSLCTKPGWGRPQGAEGSGWIVLALVIFGGWHPLRAAAGAYLFAFLQVSGIYLQNWFPSVPAQVFQVAPFPLMIFTLLLINLTQKEPLARWVETKVVLKRLFTTLSGAPPSSLGKPYLPSSD